MPNISEIPVLNGRTCYRLTVLSSFQPPKKPLISEAAKLARYNKVVELYIRGINNKFVGQEYTMLTGESIEYSAVVEPWPPLDSFRVTMTITCPLHVDYEVFKAAALARWEANIASGPEIFFEDDRAGHHCRDRPISARGWWQRTFGA